MMTRTAPVVPLSPRGIAQIALTAFALTYSTLALSSYSDEQRPISDFLHRAQTKADAHSFAQLMVVLGKKPDVSESQNIKKAPHNEAATPAALPRAQPASQKVAQLPEVTIIDRAEAHEITTNKQEITTTKKDASTANRKRPRNVHAVRQPAGAWAHRVSGILRSAGVRF